MDPVFPRLRVLALPPWRERLLDPAEFGDGRRSRWAIIPRLRVRERGYAIDRDCGSAGPTGPIGRSASADGKLRGSWGAGGIAGARAEPPDTLVVAEGPPDIVAEGAGLPPVVPDLAVSRRTEAAGRFRLPVPRFGYVNGGRSSEIPEPWSSRLSP